MKTKIPTMTDHDFCLKACADPRSTEEERELLSYVASMAAASEPVTQDEYKQMQCLTGSLLTVEGSIFDREET